MLTESDIRTLKLTLFHYLKHETSSILREKLNECVVTICCTSFPSHFEEALEYCRAVLVKGAEEINSNTFSESEANRQHFDTIRKLFKAAAQKRVQAKPDYYRLLVQALFPSLLVLWNYYTDVIITGKASVLQLVLGSLLDSIIIFGLRLGTPASLHESADMKEVIKRLLLKVEAALKLLAVEERELMNQPDKLEAWETTAKILTYELSYVQNLSPLAFIEVLYNYLRLVLGLALAPWRSVHVKKGCVLMLFRTLKLQGQYDPKGLHSRSMGPDQQAQAEKAYGMYAEAFGQQILENLMTEILTRIMTVDEGEKDNKLENMLEEEEPDNIDQVDNEMECSLRKISLSLVEQLVLSFPSTLVLIHSLAERLITDKLEADLKTRDSVVTVLGLLPQLYLKAAHEGPVLDIGKVLDWMFSKCRLI